MAKYVGKIFKVDNKKLGLRKSKTHFVYVQWFDPKNKNFKCRVISSLETERFLKRENHQIVWWFKNRLLPMWY